VKKISFTKMQGSGNDFIVIQRGPKFWVPSSRFVVRVCDRKFGIGADGVLLLEKSKNADAHMRVFNADGSEARMCGNGARCAAFYYSKKTKLKSFNIETKAGLLGALVRGDHVKIKMTDPCDLKLGMKVYTWKKEYTLDYVNTGVPHAVIEVNDLENIPIKAIGRQIRHHRLFAPRGTNVDFIKVKDGTHISVRTYERGVEDETLACGTGSVASAIMAVLNHRAHALEKNTSAHKVFVTTQSGEVLRVYFKLSKYNVSDVWLEGNAKIVFKGEYFFK